MSLGRWLDVTFIIHLPLCLDRLSNIIVSRLIASKNKIIPDMVPCDSRATAAAAVFQAFVPPMIGVPPLRITGASGVYGARHRERVRDGLGNRRDGSMGSAVAFRIQFSVLAVFDLSLPVVN